MTEVADPPMKLRTYHRVECRDCDHTLSAPTALAARSDAANHVSSTGHQVVAIAENRTLFFPAVPGRQE